MKLYKSRYIVQVISFFVLIYGFYFGLRFKAFLPILSCVNTNHYSGACYLLPFQNLQYGSYFARNEVSFLSFPAYTIIWGKVLAYSLFFISIIIFALVISKLWCGWICPFGSLQEWVSFLRKKLFVRETRFSAVTKERIGTIKYFFLFLFLGMLFAQLFGFRADTPPIYCHMCPTRPFLSVFQGNLLNFGIGYPPGVLFSIVTCILAAVVFVGMIFKERFFCNFCPVMAFLNIFTKFSILKLRKNVSACDRCGNCRRICPMGLDSVYSKEENVLKEDCILCLKCIEKCSQKNARTLGYFIKNTIDFKGYLLGLLNK